MTTPQLSLSDDLFANTPGEPAEGDPLAGIVMPGSEDDAPPPGQGTSRNALIQLSDHLGALDNATLMGLAVGDKDTVSKLEAVIRTAHRLDNQIMAQELRAELRRRVNRAPTDLVLQMYKAMSLEGGLTPKDDKNAAGGGFQLVINLGEAQQKPVTIEAT